MDYKLKQLQKLKTHLLSLNSKEKEKKMNHNGELNKNCDKETQK